MRINKLALGAALIIVPIAGLPIMASHAQVPIFQTLNDEEIAAYKKAITRYKQWCGLLDHAADRLKTTQMKLQQYSNEFEQQSDDLARLNDRIDRLTADQAKISEAIYRDERRAVARGELPTVNPDIPTTEQISNTLARAKRLSRKTEKAIEWSQIMRTGLSTEAKRTQEEIGRYKVVKEKLGGLLGKLKEEDNPLNILSPKPPTGKGDEKLPRFNSILVYLGFISSEIEDNLEDLDELEADVDEEFRNNVGDEFENLRREFDDAGIPGDRKGPESLENAAEITGTAVKFLSEEVALIRRIFDEAPPIIEPALGGVPGGRVARVPNTDQSEIDDERGTENQSGELEYLSDTSWGSRPNGGPGAGIDLIDAVPGRNPFTQRSVNLDLFYRYQNIPNVNFKTADFFSGTPNTILLGPDDADGFGGKFDVQVPLDLFTTNVPDDLFLNFIIDGQVLKASERTTFMQAPGTQQIVGGVGGTGTTFGLNTITTFDTSFDAYELGGGASIGRTITDANYWLFAALNANLRHRSTDIDINYTTGNVGGPAFNSFSNIDADEFIVRPTVTVGGGFRGFKIPGTDVVLQFNGDVEVGPSIHFADFNYSDCGSTDGAGGPCNGGFFRTTAGNNATDVGLYAAFTAGVAANVTDKLKLEASGSVVVDSYYQHDLNSNIVTTPGTVVSFGGASQSLKSNVGFVGKIRATFIF